MKVKFDQNISINFWKKASYSFDDDDEDYSNENGVANGAKCNGRCSAKNGTVPVLNVSRENVWNQRREQLFLRVWFSAQLE